MTNLLPNHLPARLHAAAGALSMITIAGLQAWLALGETSGYPDDIAAQRQGALWVMGLVLIPALMAAGGSGTWLGRGWRSPLAVAKARRMKIVAALGAGLLVPLAVALWWLAANGMIEGRFVLLQRIETLAALTNLLLLAQNFADGLRLRRPARQG